MNLRIGFSLISGLVAAVLLTGGQPSPASEVAPEGIEILGRGPVHEAFAQPLDDPQAGPIAPKPPPEPIEEQAPAQKPEGDAVQWVPGYWQWDDERSEFLWVSGVWRNPPPREWVPGSWRQTDQGFQWSDGFWAPENADSLEYLPPPPASVEEGPSVAAPTDDSVYVPGLWVYRESRYVWRPGYWLRSRPGWVWNPSYYLGTPAGYLYVPGCWDYPLEQRGILFAPVRFAGRAYPRQWSPSYAVGLDFLPTALFVRSGHRQYYYGDYFTAGYRRSGFTPWVDFSIGRGVRDPLFGYYSTVNAGRSWEHDVRGLYTDRFAGRADRPPRTLGQQNTVIRNTNVTVLRPLAQSAPAQTRLVDVNRIERDRFQQTTTQFRSAAVQRVRTERELIVRMEAPSRTVTTPRSVKIDVPRVIQSTPTPRFEAPRRSVTPAHTQFQSLPKIESVKPVIPATIPHQSLPRIETPKPRQLHVEAAQHSALKPAFTATIPHHTAAPRVEASVIHAAPVVHSAPHRPAAVTHAATHSATVTHKPAPKPSRPQHKP